MFPNHLRTSAHEVFTAVLLGAGILAISFNYSFSGWCAIILGVANTPAAMIGLGCVVTKLALDKKRWRYFLMLVIAAIVIVSGCTGGEGVVD